MEDSAARRNDQHPAESPCAPAGPAETPATARAAPRGLALLNAKVRRFFAETTAFRPWRWPASVLAVLLVRLMFVVTYSPNLSMDAMNYLDMILRGKSNLIHASGYPFLFSIFFHNGLMKHLYRWHPQVVLYSIITIHNLVSALVLLYVFRTIQKTFGKLAAHVTVLLQGLNWGAIALTSLVCPEWLQSDLLALSLCFLLQAVRAEGFAATRKYYVGVALALTMSVLVKFNAFFFTPLFLLVLVMHRLPLRSKGKCVLAMGISSVLLFSAFEFLYHRPTTGTFTLTCDKAWVFFGKLSSVFPGERLSPAYGTATKRFLLISSSLPGKGSELPRGAFPNVNYFPAAIKAPWRPLYDRIMAADDATLDAMITEKGEALYDNYELCLSWCKINYYVGFLESDALATRVFLEVIRARPREYFARVLEDTERELISSDSYSVFPIEIVDHYAPQGFSYKEKGQTRSPDNVITASPVGLGFYSLQQTAELHYQTFGDPHGYYVWMPGAYFFSWLVRTERLMPGALPLIAILTGLGLLILRIVRKRCLDIQGRSFLMIAGFLLFFIVCSNVIFGFRWEKELRLVMPLIAFLLAVTLAWLVELITACFGRGNKTEKV